MDDIYKKYLQNKLDELKTAIILSPKQVNSFIKFLDVTEKDVYQNKNNHPELEQDFNSELNILKILKNKLSDISNNTPMAFTLFEGIILTSLTMTFKYTHYDIDKIGKDIEEIGRLLDDLFHEKGYLPFFFILKEDRLEEN